ncbi:MAG: MAPEG family protein [Pseudomonadota bacterium]
MSIELWSLLIASVMVASLWIPFIVGVNMHLPATEELGLRPPDLRLLPDWVQRANRAHLNLVEQFVPFAALVLVAQLADVSSVVTEWTCIAFVGLRIAHALGYITAWARIPARPAIFTLAWLALLVLAVEIARLSLA